MQDEPQQAQAKGYFKCILHEGKVPVDYDDDDVKDAAKKGCVVCNAQVNIGDIFIREKMDTKTFYDGK